VHNRIRSSLLECAVLPEDALEVPWNHCGVFAQVQVHVL